ncbi:MAG: Dna2/Cas4 domain-containing protein [Bacteroidales bacterium]|nr:Dna2/Cas4 domain-containing protein [Bacteroidales bacterium]
MLSDEAMIVVDFKFGKPEKKYRQQVAMYCELLLQMGYKNISGYLWYVDDKQIDAINTAQLL